MIKKPSLDTSETFYLKTKEVGDLGTWASVVGGLLSVSKVLDLVSLTA